MMKNSNIVSDDTILATSNFHLTYYFRPWKWY